MRGYYLFLYPDRVVGPYNLHSLREWLAMGIISAKYQVCPVGAEAWTCLSEVSGHDNIPARLEQRMAARRSNIQRDWWLQPATERQRAKLDYFSIPYEATGLTKARAAELIGYFVEIDPLSEETYRLRPADADQLATLQRFGLDGEGLTHKQAKSLIEAARWQVHMEAVECRVAKERRLIAELGLSR